MDIVELVRRGEYTVDWGNLIITIDNLGTLIINVMRDALKFDGVPSMTWDRKVIDPNNTRDGVRLGATAKEMQEIADLLHCMLLTPKVVDLVWRAAGDDGVQFGAITQVGGQIVAVSNIHDVHDSVEEAIAATDGDQKRGFIDAVGKYWVVCNRLVGGKFGQNQAINYGWFSSGAPSISVTGAFKLWQNIGGAHDTSHYDPSQVIRLMKRNAFFQEAGADTKTWRDVDLYDIATDPELSQFLSHEGPLKAVRVLNVPEPDPIEDNVLIQFPDMAIRAD